MWKAGVASVANRAECTPHLSPRAESYGSREVGRPSFDVAKALRGEKCAQALRAPRANVLPAMKHVVTLRAVQARCAQVLVVRGREYDDPAGRQQALAAQRAAQPWHETVPVTVAEVVVRELRFVLPEPTDMLIGPLEGLVPADIERAPRR